LPETPVNGLIPAYFFFPSLIKQELETKVPKLEFGNQD
jgi:hypothetical protein